jgi:hypothetical protein
VRNPERRDSSPPQVHRERQSRWYQTPQVPAGRGGGFPSRWACGLSSAAVDSIRVRKETGDLAYPGFQETKKNSVGRVLLSGAKSPEVGFPELRPRRQKGVDKANESQGKRRRDKVRVIDSLNQLADGKEDAGGQPIRCAKKKQFRHGSSRESSAEGLIANVGKNLVDRFLRCSIFSKHL